MRRHSPTLAAPLALALLLFGCGDQSDTASQAVPDAEDIIEDASLPDDEAGTGGYEQIDQSEYGDQQAAAEPDYAPPPQPVPQQTATQAVGAGVQGDVEMFYDALDRDGAWVEHPDYSYVWLPSRMGPGWRPYQEGRWIWTDDYGWYWESEEPFAWAVYHYGRWDYDPDYGWFWVPGDTWAPAWVTWRVGGDSVGWAPIAPDRPGFATGAPRRYAPPVAESWIFVDAPDFTAPDLAPHVRPISRIGPSLEAAREVRNPRFDRNRVVNYGAPPEEMRRYARGPIETRHIYYVGNRNDVFDDRRDGRLGIYRPVIRRGERHGPPPRLADVGQTRRVVIGQFAGSGPEGLFSAPSVALLDVLAPRERRSLAEARLTKKQAAVDARIEELRREREALVEERRKQAKKLEAKLEKERQEAKAERKKLREALRAEKQKRAATIKLQAPVPTEAATPAPAAEPPVESAVAPAEPAPPAPSGAAAPPPPAETGAVEEPKAEEPPAPDVGAAEPALAPEPPAAAPEPAPAPEQAAEPAPEPAPEQEAKETPPPAEEPQPSQEAPAPPAAAQDDRQDAPRKRRRPVEAARPAPSQPDELPPPAETAPPPAPPEAMQPPPPEAPGPAAEAPSDPARPVEKAKKRKRLEGQPAEATPEAPAASEPAPPAGMPNTDAPPPVE